MFYGSHRFLQSQLQIGFCCICHCAMTKILVVESGYNTYSHGGGTCGVPLVASLKSNTQLSQRNHHGWKTGWCAIIQDENEEGFTLIKCYNVHKNQPISTLTPQCISRKILQSDFVVPTANCIFPIFGCHAITTRVMQRKSMLNSAFLRTW